MFNLSLKKFSVARGRHFITLINAKQVSGLQGINYYSPRPTEKNTAGAKCQVVIFDYLLYRVRYLAECSSVHKIIKIFYVCERQV